MKTLIGSICIITVLLYATQYSVLGQLDPSPLQLEELQLVDPECTLKRVLGTSALTPFTLRTFYDITSTRSNEVTHPVQQMVPTTQQTDQVFVFFTPHVEEYQVVVRLSYPDARDRVFFYEYMHEGERLHSSQEKITTKNFCMKFFILTKEPEHIPTKEEIVGDIIRATETIPALFNAFNQNTASNTQWQYAITILAVGGFTMSLISLAVTTRTISPLREIKEDFESIIEIGTNKIPMPPQKDDESVATGKKTPKRKLFGKLLRLKDDEDVQVPDFHHRQEDDIFEQIETEPVDEHADDCQILGRPVSVNADASLEKKQVDSESIQEVPHVMTLEQLEQKVVSSVDIKAMKGQFDEFTTEELTLVYESLNKQWRNSITDDNAKILRIIHVELLKRSGNK